MKHWDICSLAMIYKQCSICSNINVNIRFWCHCLRIKAQVYSIHCSPVFSSQTEEIHSRWGRDTNLTTDSGISRPQCNAATRPCVLSRSVAAITHWLGSYIYILSPCKHLWLNVTSSLQKLFDVLREPCKITSWSSSWGGTSREGCGFTPNKK